ncbi:hypothetical protein GCM10022206_91580 [Streptomyces chiangmaiensis]
MDVVGTQPEVADQGPAGRRKPSLGADRGLGRARGTGGEIQQEAVGRGGPRVLRLGPLVSGDEVRAGVRVGHQQPDSREVEPVQQREEGALGDQDAALGVQDVSGQLRPAASGVDPGDGRTREGRRAQPQRILGRVVQQHPEVRLGARREQIGEQRRPGRRARRHLVPGERPTLEPQPRPVVPPPLPYQLRDGTPRGLHGGAE